MTKRIDDDQLDLARALATRAGMLFEDASITVILIGKIDAEELRGRIGEARTMIERADTFLRAAGALLDIQYRD